MFAFVKKIFNKPKPEPIKTEEPQKPKYEKLSEPEKLRIANMLESKLGRPLTMPKPKKEEKEEGEEKNLPIRKLQDLPTSGNKIDMDLNAPFAINSFGGTQVLPTTSPKDLDINYYQLARLFQIGCTVSEAAYIFGTTEPALATAVKLKTGATVGELAEYHRQNLKMSLRRTQFEVALKKKDTKMLIHLGKHYLDQVDGKTSSLTKTDVPDNVLIQIVQGDQGISKATVQKEGKREVLEISQVGEKHGQDSTNSTTN